MNVTVSLCLYKCTHILYNGSIRAKRSALKHSKLNDGKKDEGIGNWLTINSTDDFFQI